MSPTGDPGDQRPATPRSPALADEVYRIVREELLSRRTAPGERINLDALARDLHMSTTPVRRALTRLTEDGLVRKVPRRGFVASPLLDSRTIAEIYDFRMMLEPVLAGRAARRNGADLADALAALCDPDGVEAMLAATADETAIGRRDVDFHTIIAEQAGNNVATEALCRTFERSISYLLSHEHDAVRAAWQEHRLIAAAISAGDAEQAANGMRTHLRNGLQRFQAAIA